MPNKVEQNSQQTAGRRKSESAVPHRGACDRCRGQKLRCVWEPGSRPCRRCDRAKAVCSVSPPRPMGRPLAASSRNRLAQNGTSHEVHPIDSACLPSSPEEHALAHAPTNEHSFSVGEINTTPPDISWEASFSSMMDGACPPASCIQPQYLDFFNLLPAPAVFDEHINVQVADNNHNDVNISDPETQSFESCQDINDVMQLCKLTIALSKHPLHSAATSATQILCRKLVRLADLKIGRLLSVTAQISTILARIASLRTVDELSQADTSCHRQAQSTVLLVLSCYSRLEVMFSGAIDALQELRKSNKLLDDSHTLVTGVVIDGFSLGTSQELQVRFITQLCEQTRGMILQAAEECKEPNSTTLYGIGVAIGKLLSP